MDTRDYTEAITIQQGTFYSSPTEDVKMFYNISKLGVFFDTNYVATIGKYVTPDSTVVDIGANIGEFSFAIAPLVQKIYAFEPVLRSRELLKKNVATQSNVEVIACALGNKEGSVDLTPDTKNNSGTYRVTGQGTIPLNTLDSFSLKPNFIKIDVQGLDVRVLQGAQKTITENKPTILFEICDLTVKYGGILSLPKILQGYKLQYFPSLKEVSIPRLYLELVARYYLRRPRHYDILATPLS